MQELFAEKDFFDWMRAISRAYGNAMAEWGQQVHLAVSAPAGSAIADLATATDAATDRLVSMLMAIGRRHEDAGTPRDGHEVLDALDRLLGASAELLRDARAGLTREGIGALAALSPRIVELRTLEAEVERASARLSSTISDLYGRPETG
jgi:hypothetical protein